MATLYRTQASRSNVTIRPLRGEVGLVLFREVICDLGEGVPDGEREQPTIDLDTLPVGMSDDFCVTIEEGTTSVRIGRVIFGNLA